MKRKYKVRGYLIYKCRLCGKLLEREQTFHDMQVSRLALRDFTDVVCMCSGINSKPRGICDLVGYKFPD